MIRVRLLPVVIFGVLSASALPSSQTGDAASPIVINGKFDTSTEHLLIPVTIGGHQFWCNPDTGFGGVIALDRAKAVKAGLQVAPGVATPDGNPPSATDSSTTADLVVGGVAYPAHSIILRAMPEEAPDMDCIMAVALLRRFVVEFDFMQPRLLLHDRSAYRPTAGAATIPLLFRPNPNVPYVDIGVIVAGTRLPVRVVPDTGAAFYGAVIVGPVATRIQALTPTAKAIVYSDSRINELLAARPAEVTVGPFSVADPVIGLVQGSLGGSGIADGVLGEGFFRRFAVAFDFEGRAMYLRPNPRLRQPHAFDASGLSILRRDGKLLVYGVIVDTPAAVAGVQEGDELLEIDGRPTDRLTIVQVRDLMNVHGAQRRLLLVRGGQRMMVTLQLRARI